MTGRLAMVLVVFGTSLAAADPVWTALPDPPPKKPEAKSLRDEAVRVATELAAVESRRDPDLLLQPWAYGRWFQSGKAGNLAAGAAAATLVGEAAMAFDASPFAVIGAFAAAITLDSAASDVEAATPPPKKSKPRPKHRLR